MKLEVYRRADERWAWRLVSCNGNIIATDGGQGYERRYDCLVSAFKATYATFREDIELVVELEPRTAVVFVRTFDHEEGRP